MNSTGIRERSPETKPARVLINALSLTHGGGRSYLLNLLHQLEIDPRGCEPTIVVARGQLSPKESRGIKTVAIPLPRSPSVLRLAIRLLVEQFILPFYSLRYHVLYCIADMTPLLSATPTVVLLRNLNIYDRRFYDNLRLRALYSLTQIGLRRAKRVVFPTRAAAKMIQEKISVPEHRLLVAPYGVSHESFDKSASVDPSHPYILVPAALERHKNIEVVIKALEQSKRDFDLWLVGPDTTDTRYVETLKTLARELGVSERIRFVGPVPYSEMQSYYRGALAMVLPSEIETFGHPILEAMLSGAPVAASDIPTFRELAGEAALYFPPHDPIALRDAIEEIAQSSSAVDRRRSLGRSRATQFTWTKHADILCEALRDLSTH